MKIVILILFIFFNSCTNESTKSFHSLSEAFNSWYLIHHQISNNSKFSLNNYIVKKIGDKNYINEYLEDLKRFKLELNQVNANHLNKLNQYEHTLIMNQINNLILEIEKMKVYIWNPSYYSKNLYNHTLHILLNDNISSYNKNNIILDILDFLPQYFMLSQNNISTSNDYLKNKSIDELISFSNLLEYSLEDLNFDINVSKLFDKKILNSKQVINKQINWIEQNLNNTDVLNKKIIYEKYKEKLESQYDDIDIFNLLNISIVNLQNNIFDLSFSIYIKDNDEPIWVDREDSLNIIRKVLQNNYNNNINKDFDSKVIEFNDSFSVVNNFLKNNNIVYIDTSSIQTSFYNPFDYYINTNEYIYTFNKLYHDENINIFIGKENKSKLSNSRLFRYIIEGILPEYIYHKYSQHSNINVQSKINSYVWGKMLSRIIIENNFNEIDPYYELEYNLSLLQDFIILLIEYEYLFLNTSKDECIAKLMNQGFYDMKFVDDIFNKIIYSSDFNLEKYAAYILMSNSYDYNCILNNNINDKTFINNIFSYGFLPIYNYNNF